jgi:ABC-type thiamine transport system ATPase subunit
VLQIVDAVGRRRDMTIIYVTHDPLALPATVSHVLRLDRGQIVARGRVPGPADDRNDGGRWNEHAE